MPKIREVDDLLRERLKLRGRIREIHPEICFWGLTDRPMRHSKKTREGFEERVGALVAHRPDARDAWESAFVQYGGLEAERDDIVDALAAALCALHAKDCRTLPQDPEIDPEGLPMEMVYWPSAGR
jgi:predicted RNase H-like nuclease